MSVDNRGTLYLYSENGGLDQGAYKTDSQTKKKYDISHNIPTRGDGSTDFQLPDGKLARRVFDEVVISVRRILVVVI